MSGRKVQCLDNFIADLRELSEFTVGDGRRICFWEDKWCGIEPLGVAFHSLYTMAVSKGAFVAETWDHSEEVGGWNPRFLRDFNDWELELVCCLFFALQGKRICSEAKDILVWIAVNNEVLL